MGDDRQAPSADRIVDAPRGRRLRAARERAGIAQQVAADSLGITRGTLRRWELGYWMPGEAFEPLATLYRVGLAELRDGAVREPVRIVPAPPEAPSGPLEPAWPQWARERWAEVYLELVRAGASDEEVTFLRGLVLSPLTAAYLGVLDDAAIARDVQAGIVAARAWFAARHAETPPTRAAS